MRSETFAASAIVRGGVKGVVCRHEEDSQERTEAVGINNLRQAQRLWRCLFAALILGATGLGAATPSENIIVIGAAVSLTGKYAQNGINTKNGYDLAARKINDQGGIKIAGKDYRIVLRYYDDESTPARGTELAERLIQQDGVRFLLGPYSSGLTKAILPIVEKHKVPMIEAARRASCSPRATAIFSRCCRLPISISHRPSISPPSTPRISARRRRRCALRSPWRMTRSPRMCARAGALPRWA